MDTDPHLLQQVADILRKECHDKGVRFEVDERNLRAFKGEQLVFHGYLEESGGHDYFNALLTIEDHPAGGIIADYEENTPRELADRLLVDLEDSDLTIKLGDDWI